MEKILNYIERAKKFRTKKRLGQNFLVDKEIIDRIIKTANLTSDETVIEIGAGAGFVTEELAKRVKKVIAIELDEDAVRELKKLPYSNIEIFNQDILKTDFSQFVDMPKQKWFSDLEKPQKLEELIISESRITNSQIPCYKPVKVIANIPYYITSPILAHLIGEIDQIHWKNRELISEIILMVQYEVAKRIIATEKSPSKEYGLLSILVNYRCLTELICKVPAKSFYPAPKVDSALLKLTLRQEPLVNISNPKLFRKITQAAFGTRRKTIKNALLNKGFNEKTILYTFEKAGIDPKIRGERLSINNFNNLTEIFAQQLH